MHMHGISLVLADRVRPCFGARLAAEHTNLPHLVGPSDITGDAGIDIRFSHGPLLS